MSRIASAIVAKKRALAIAVGLILFASAAGLLLAQDSSLSGLDPRLVAKGTGSSGLKWIGGNKDSPLMNPGSSCIACHAKMRGPRYTYAGTVYAKLDEKDNDFGVEGATVQVTDAKGAVLKMVTNKAGNFFAGRGAAIAAPYTAKVVFKGAERKMITPQAVGDCMACHTAKGAGGASGRIAIP